MGKVVASNVDALEVGFVGEEVFFDFVHVVVRHEGDFQQGVELEHIAVEASDLKGVSIFLENAI